MKFILIFTYISLHSNLSFHVITDKTFAFYEDCASHEVQVDSRDFNISMLCIEDWEVEQYTRDYKIYK
jgi:hypothetical protein